MIGTGILGALLAYPVAAVILGKQVALFAYIIPFSMSCTAGAVIAYLFVKIPVIKKILLNNEAIIDRNDSTKINEI